MLPVACAASARRGIRGKQFTLGRSIANDCQGGEKGTAEEEQARRESRARGNTLFRGEQECYFLELEETVTWSKDRGIIFENSVHTEREIRSCHYKD
jgi:hypothetical protein